MALTLYVGVERHVEHSPAEGIRRGLRPSDYELAHGVDEVLVGERGAGISRVPLKLIQVGVDVVARHVRDPALREFVYDPQQEVVDLGRVGEELLVFPEGHVLDPGKGVVEEGPAAHRQLHVLAEELHHVLEVVVVVGEPLAEDDQVGDVGHGVGHQVLGVERLPLVLVNGVDEEHALLRDLPLEEPLPAAEVTERVAGQLPVFDPAFAVFTVEEPLGGEAVYWSRRRHFRSDTQTRPQVQGLRGGSRRLLPPILVIFLNSGSDGRSANTSLWL